MRPQIINNIFFYIGYIGILIFTIVSIIDKDSEYSAIQASIMMLAMMLHQIYIKIPSTQPPNLSSKFPT